MSLTQPENYSFGASFDKISSDNMKIYQLKFSNFLVVVVVVVLHLFLANKTRATQKNTSKQQPKTGNSNKRYTECTVISEDENNLLS